MSEVIQYILTNKVEIIAVVSSALVVLSQIAALAGKPKIVEKIAFISSLFDKLAGNYGKAQNKE